MILSLRIKRHRESGYLFFVPPEGCFGGGGGGFGLLSPVGPEARSPPFRLEGGFAG